MVEQTKQKHINNLNTKIKKNKKRENIYCAKPEVDLCVSALGGWVFRFGPDRWTH